MVYDPERERRNDAVHAEHKQALARGEKRVLRTTATGELHSYAGEEIGFTPGAGQVQIVQATQNGYELMSTSESDLGGANHTFTITHNIGGVFGRSCTVAAEGGCRGDGSW